MSGQNHLARNSKRGKKTRQTEEKVGRQHPGTDRPGVRQVPEGSGEQGKMEETGCEIICGAPTTLAVKGLLIMMIMMMMMTVAKARPLVLVLCALQSASVTSCMCGESVQYVTSRPQFFCSSLVTIEPTWLYPEKLKECFIENGYSH